MEQIAHLKDDLEFKQMMLEMFSDRQKTPQQTPNRGTPVDATRRE